MTTLLTLQKGDASAVPSVPGNHAPALRCKTLEGNQPISHTESDLFFQFANHDSLHPQLHSPRDLRLELVDSSSSLSVFRWHANPRFQKTTNGFPSSAVLLFYAGDPREASRLLASPLTYFAGEPRVILSRCLFTKDALFDGPLGFLPANSSFNDVCRADFQGSLVFQGGPASLEIPFPAFDSPAARSHPTDIFTPNSSEPGLFTLHGHMIYALDQILPTDDLAITIASLTPRDALMLTLFRQTRPKARAMVFLAPAAGSSIPPPYRRLLQHLDFRLITTVSSADDRLSPPLRTDLPLTRAVGSHHQVLELARFLNRRGEIIPVRILL
jgi:hypothetical protein